MTLGQWPVLLFALVTGCDSLNTPTDPARVTLDLASAQPVAVVGDEVIMYTDYDMPAVGTKYHLTAATGASECHESAPPDAPQLYPARIVGGDGDRGSGSPVWYAFSKPLAAGTELTFVRWGTAGVQCSGAYKDGLLMTVTKAPASGNGAP